MWYVIGIVFLGIASIGVGACMYSSQLSRIEEIERDHPDNYGL